MGLNAIGCEGDGVYTAKAKKGAGSGIASDFNGTDLQYYSTLLASAVIAVFVGNMAVLESKNHEESEPPASDRFFAYDKNSTPVTVGRLDDDGDLLTRDAVLKVGDQIFLRPLPNDSDGGENKTLECVVTNSFAPSDNIFPLSGGIYDVKCTGGHKFGYTPKVDVYQGYGLKE